MSTRGYPCPPFQASRSLPRNARCLSGNVADAVPLISQYPAQDVRDANALDAHIAAQHVCKFDRPDSRRQPSAEKLADDRKCEDAPYVKHCSWGFNGEQKRTSVHTFVNSFGTNGSEGKGYGIASTFAKTRDDLSTGRGGPYPEHHLPTSENYVHDGCGVRGRVRLSWGGPRPYWG